MPHLFVNRPRLHDLTKGSKQIEAQFRWETINAFIYKAGGVIFIAGSILFFPRFEAYADWGAWTYFVGSFLYLIVTGHDLMEVVRYRRIHGKGDRYEKLEYIAAVWWHGNRSAERVEEASKGNEHGIDVAEGMRGYVIVR
jgi:hypothetical protein